MRTTHHLFLILIATLTLTACQGAGIAPQTQGSSSSAVSSSASSISGALFMIDIPEVGLHFPYWEKRIIAGEVNSGINDPARKGEYWFGLTHTGEMVDPQDSEIAGMYYKKASDGLGDWNVPVSVRDALMKRIDETSCDLLAAKNIYLPLNAQKPHLCKATATLDGALPVIVMVGMGQPYEGTDFPESMIVLFTKDKAVIVRGLAQFPETTAAMKKISAEHMKKYPDTEYPNAHYQILFESLSAMLEKAFQNPSVEMKNNLNLLLSVGRAIRVD